MEKKKSFEWFNRWLEQDFHVPFEKYFFIHFLNLKKLVCVHPSQSSLLFSQHVSMWLSCLNLTKSYPCFVIKSYLFARIRCTGQKLLNETLKERLHTSAMDTTGPVAIREGK